MRINDLPDISILRRTFTYNKRTGILRWRPRAQSSFANNSKQAWHAWNTKYAGKPVGYFLRGYLMCTLFGKQGIKVHRICFTLGSGQNIATNTVVDHRNKPESNNRFSNLRIATSAQNSQNMVNKRGRTLPKGITFYKPTGRYLGTIFVNRKRIYLGYFGTIKTAATAVAAARKQHHGEFARP